MTSYFHHMNVSMAFEIMASRTPSKKYSSLVASQSQALRDPFSLTIGYVRSTFALSARNCVLKVYPKLESR